MSSDKYKKFYNRLFTLSYDPIGNSPRGAKKFVVGGVVGHLATVSNLILSWVELWLGFNNKIIFIAT